MTFGYNNGHAYYVVITSFMHNIFPGTTKFKLSSILSPQQQKKQKEQQSDLEEQTYNLFISKRMKGWWTLESYKKDGGQEKTVRTRFGALNTELIFDPNLYLK